MLFASVHYVGGTGAARHRPHDAVLGQGLLNEGAPMLGPVIRLDYADKEIDALDPPAWKTAIARAASRYGIVIGDHGSGGRGLAFHAESGSAYESFGHVDSLVAYAKRVGMRPYRDAAIGGSTYRFDLAADIDWSRLEVVDPCVIVGPCRPLAP